ncbi:DUF427 domain-containing protein [soil metagenome]|jgi:uncharacterized protein (DUF427 family)
MTRHDRRLRREVAGEGQESVWDYPRPPRQDPSSRQVVVRLGNTLVADTRNAIRVLETSHPPTWYLPRDDVRDGTIRRSDSRPTRCEFKGLATYYDVLGEDGAVAHDAAWSYEQPTPDFLEITSFLSFMPGRLRCEIDGERVRPQDGGFYGGWITHDVVGPFKGAPGTLGW